MNLQHATDCINTATAILREDNDCAERISYWRREVTRLEAESMTKPDGVEAHLANIRLLSAQLALTRMMIEEAESARLRAEEQLGRKND